jgi:hypothetical protein
MPLYNDLEVRPRYGSALPSYAPEGTRGLEPTYEDVDMARLLKEAATSGAVGSGVGGTYARAMQPYSEWRAADDALARAWSAPIEILPTIQNRKEVYNELENLIGRSNIRGDYRAGKTPKGFHGHDLWTRLGDSVEGEGIWDATNKASERYLARLPGQASGKVVSIQESPAAFNRLVDLGEDRLAAKAILSPEVDEYLRREAGLEFEEAKRRLGRKEGRIFSEEELARNSRLNKKALRADQAAWGDALQDLYYIEERGGIDTSPKNQGRRLTGERIEELMRDVPVDGGVAGGPLFFPTKAGGRMLVNLLKETLRPRNVLLDATLGAGVGAGSAGLGYASAAPESAGLFTPPGPGYEGLVTAEDIEAAAEAKELRNEAERQRLLEQYRASGYDLDPNTRLRDLR